jgi:hypothetical protein
MSGTADFSDLPAYFAEIEDSFSARRNAPLLLSPLDFEKVAEWHAAEIPAAVIKNGIAAYFEKLDKRKTPLRRAICISFAEDCILKALEEYRLARIGAQCGMDGGQMDEKSRKEKFLDHLEEKLRKRLAENNFSAVYKNSSALISALINIINDLRSGGKNSLVDIENKLSPLDSELGRLLLSETPGELRDKWINESREKLRRAGIDPEDAMSQAAEKNILLNRAFHNSAIPRLSILYYDE